MNFASEPSPQSSPLEGERRREAPQVSELKSPLPSKGRGQGEGSKMRSLPVRVLLIGAAGRMGKTVLDLAQSDREIEIAAQCDLDDSIEAAMKSCDVAIDFSHADASTKSAAPPHAWQIARHRNDRSLSGATHDH